MDELSNHSNQSAPPPAAKPGKARRGFAGMDPERQREIARQGGRAAHVKGVAHEFTPEEAAAAGRKGGLASRRRNARQDNPRQ